MGCERTEVFRYDSEILRHGSGIEKCPVEFPSAGAFAPNGNMIYNDLIRRGYSVDVGIVELTRVIEGKRKMSQYEIDFVVNVGNDKVYIQSALNVDTPEKKAQETFSLRNTGDFFRKIVVLDGNSKLWADDDGVMYVGVIPFLLDDIVAEVIR